MIYYIYRYINIYFFSFLVSHSLYPEDNGPIDKGVDNVVQQIFDFEVKTEKNSFFQKNSHLITWGCLPIKTTAKGQIMLSGREISKQVTTGAIEIEPYSENLVNPNSYNLRLGGELFEIADEVIDPYKRPTLIGLHPTKIGLHDGAIGWKLDTGKLYLASTLERTRTDKYIPQIDGRSSIGRLGLAVHITAGFGDVGFNGQWTLELFAMKPILLYVGMPIAQVYFHEITGDFDLYSGKYQGSTGVRGSLLSLENVPKTED